MNHRHIQAYAYGQEEADILIYEAITEYSSASFIYEFRYLEAAGVKKINVRINSGGGSVQYGYAIVSAILSSSATIHTYVDGVAASMAAFIFLCGEQRIMKDYATLMFHAASYPPDFQANENDTAALESYNQSLATLTAKRLGITEEQARETYMKPGVDSWFTASEAKAERLADKIEVTGKAGIQAATRQSLSLPEIQAFYTSLLPKQNQMNREMICAALGIPATATDQEILAKATAQLENVRTMAGELAAAKAEVSTIAAELTEAKQKLEQHEKAAAEAQEARVQKLIADAVAQKKIAGTEEVKNTWLSLARANFTETEKAIGVMRSTGLLSASIDHSKTTTPDKPAFKPQTITEKMAAIDAANRKR